MISIVTGASSGIGQAIYNYLKEQTEVDIGRVIGVSRRGPDVSLDLARPDRIYKLLAQVKFTGEKIKLLVNNAGVLLPTEEERHRYRELFEVNLFAAFELIHLCSPFMSKGSSIINIGSHNATRPKVDYPLYSASKAALVAMTAAMTIPLGRQGVRINCINPGYFLTPMVPDHEIMGAEELKSFVPIGRDARAEEIVPAVRMLLTSDYMTGAIIDIDGGLQWKPAQ